MAGMIDEDDRKIITELVKLSVQKGADPYFKDDEGQTAFDLLGKEDTNSARRLAYWIERNSSSKKACLKHLDFVIKHCTMDVEMGKALGGIRHKLEGKSGGDTATASSSR